MAQMNTSVGAIAENCNRMRRFLDQALDEGVDLVVFPELAVIGYPPRDLMEQEGFVEEARAAFEEVARSCKKIPFIAGFVDEAIGRGKGRLNAAAYVVDGKIRFVQHKRLLPTYDVFDEWRYFDRGLTSELVQIGEYKVGMTICEDIWTDEAFLGKKLYDCDPALELAEQGADLLINLSASPYHEGQPQIREELLKKVVSKAGTPLLYVNLVGGNDELLFDGGSLALDASGNIIGRGKVFEEDFIVVDIKKGKGVERTWPTDLNEWRAKALSMGIRDYVHKCGFENVLIGLSGGIDSSLVALLAARALGADRVTGVSMPSRFTSSASRDDAEELSNALGTKLFTIPIESITSSFEEALQDAFEGTKRDVTEENIQARVRGNLLMALSNKFGSLVLSTGNKSELAVGYCTQYGDMAGGLAVISDLPKQAVYSLAKYLNNSMKAIPQRVFDRAPSAELAPDQKDSDSLPPYDVLDAILNLYIEQNRNIDSITSQGYDRKTVERVIQMVDRNEFKRRQAAPGLRLSSKAFGMGRRMPIARGPA